MYPLMDTIPRLLLIILIFYIPGFLISRFYGLHKKIKNIELVLLEISTSILLSGLLGMVLAHLGIFSLNLFYTMLSVLCLLILVLNRTKPALQFSMKEAACLAFFALLAITITFFNPQEAVVGGVDPGVYVATGVNIARTGSIIIHDEFIEDITNKNLTQFYYLRNKPLFGSYGNSFPGFYISKPEQGTITPQFYYMYPVWIAIFYSIFATIKSALYVVPLFSALSILMIFFFLKKIGGMKLALLSSALLTINFAQVWYSIVPNSEVMAQFFAFFSLYCIYMFTKEKSTAFGFLAALALGNGLLTRLDFSFLIPVIIAYFSYLYATGELTNARYFVIPFTLTFSYVLLVALQVSTPYTLTVYSVIGNPLPWKLGKFFTRYWALLFMALIAIFILKVIKTHRINFSSKQKLFFVSATWCIITILYFFAQRITGHASNSAVLSWYITPLGFYIGILGLIFIFLDGRKDYFLLLSCFTVYFALFSVEALISFRHPWWIRRFVPIIIPTFMAGISYFILENKLFNKSIVKKVFAAAMIILLATPFIFTSAKIFETNEFEGTIDVLDILNSTIKEPAVLLYPSSKTSYSHRFAMPLRYAYGRKTLEILNLDDQAFDYINKLMDNNNVYLSGPTRDIGNFTRRFSVNRLYNQSLKRDVISDRLRWKSYSDVYFHPGETEERTYRIELFELTKRTSDSQSNLPPEDNINLFTSTPAEPLFAT